MIGKPVPKELIDRIRLVASRDSSVTAKALSERFQLNPQTIERILAAPPAISITRKAPRSR